MECSESCRNQATSVFHLFAEHTIVAFLVCAEWSCSLSASRSNSDEKKETNLNRLDLFSFSRLSSDEG